MSSSSTAGNNKIGIQNTGSLLLAGWKMLSDVCPICNFPLMSKIDVIKCPNCNATVITETEYQQRMPKVSEVFSKTTEDTTSREGNISSTEVTEHAHPISDYTSYRKKQDAVSSKLGKKMMLGWTLLGTVCPLDSCRGTPLMSLKGQPTMECVCCESLYKTSEYGDLIPANSLVGSVASETISSNSSTMTALAPSSVKSPLQKSVTSNDASSSHSTSSHSLLDESSKLISQKLVMGWSLLSEVCTESCNGQVPLMKDLNGNVLCVCCGSGVETSKRQKCSNPVEDLSFIGPTSDDDDEDYNDESFQDIIDDMKKKRLAEITKSKVPQVISSSSSSSALSTNGLSDSVELPLVPSVRSTKNILISNAVRSRDGNSEQLIACSEKILKKIEQACIMLENSSCTTQDCIALAELVTKLGSAYRSVRESIK